MNAPNLITIGRFILVPAVISMIFSAEWVLAFTLFLVAGISDAIDGFIAKRFNMTTELGAVLDPLADKLLLISIYVALGFVGVLPKWLATIVVFRDVLIVGAVILAWFLEKPMPIRPLIISKINTFAQIGLAAVVLGSLASRIPLGNSLPVMVVIVAGLTVLSAGAYLALWLKHMAAED